MFAPIDPAPHVANDSNDLEGNTSRFGFDYLTTELCFHNVPDVSNFNVPDVRTQ